MDTRNDIRELLVARRARTTPEQAGLVHYGGKRRVEGLRREGVALLAGVSSADHDVRLEAGRDPYGTRFPISPVSSPPAATSCGFAGPLTTMFDLPGDAGRRMLVCSAGTGSPSRQRLDLLAGWASTPSEARRS